MKDLTLNTVKELSERVFNLTIESVEIDDDGMDRILVFSFKDGSKLRIEYDWINGWEVTE